jgi:hypothetical protein
MVVEDVEEAEVLTVAWVVSGLRSWDEAGADLARLIGI